MTWSNALPLALVALALSGCCPKRPPVKMAVIRRACLEAPPPSPRPLDLAGPEQGCPQAFEACLTWEGAGKLAAYLEELQRYSEQAWLGCKPEPEGTDP